MIKLVRSLRRYGLWSVALFYGGVAVLLVAGLLGIARALEVETMWVWMTAVCLFLGFPLVLGLAWAIREPVDDTGTGNVVRGD